MFILEMSASSGLVMIYYTVLSVSMIFVAEAPCVSVVIGGTWSASCEEGCGCYDKEFEVGSGT